MGCDIHMFVEYRNREADDHRGQEYWYTFGGEFHPGRDYWLFSLMAGVRGPLDPVVPPRGVPEKMGWRTTDEYWLTVVEDEDWENGGGRAEYGSTYISRTQALDYLKWNGRRKWPDKIPEEERCDENVSHIGQPDWHTPSWLTFSEYEKVLEMAVKGVAVEDDPLDMDDVESEEALPTTKSGWTPSIEYFALLEAMRTLAAQGLEVRTVFWFDN